MRIKTLSSGGRHTLTYTHTGTHRHIHTWKLAKDVRASCVRVGKVCGDDKAEIDWSLAVYCYACDLILIGIQNGAISVMICLLCFTLSPSCSPCTILLRLPLLYAFEYFCFSLSFLLPVSLCTLPFTAFALCHARCSPRSSLVPLSIPCAQFPLLLPILHALYSFTPPTFPLTYGCLCFLQNVFIMEKLLSFPHFIAYTLATFPPVLHCTCFPPSS